MAEQGIVLSRNAAERIVRVVRKVEHDHPGMVRGRGGDDFGAMEVVQFRVKSIDNDHLVCRLWDGETQGTADIRVAKPYELRVTPFNLKTIDGFSYVYPSVSYERTVTDTSDSSTEDQVIVPEYRLPVDDYEGCIIYAITPVMGLTVELNSTETVWLDINADGRAWAESDE